MHQKNLGEFFNDKNNITIALFDKHFSLLSKVVNKNELKGVYFPKALNVHLNHLAILLPFLIREILYIPVHLSKIVMGMGSLRYYHLMHEVEL
ncbi:hypothetical protein CIW64_00645 [Enterobacter cloacae]|nr:hypothetical protein CIW64_00645 [Enterobacter cloacae]